MTAPITCEAKRRGDAWFAIRFADVLRWNETEVLGKLSACLADAGFAAQLANQTIAWRRQLTILRKTAEALVAADAACSTWTLALEYEIPRRGKRIDAVVLTTNAVIVIEFKIDATSFVRADLWQAQDYALDLRDFHEESAGTAIKPVLVATAAHVPPGNAAFDEPSGVWRANSDTLAGILLELLRSHSTLTTKSVDADAWLVSEYRPTPTIVETARQVFARHNVRE